MQLAAGLPQRTCAPVPHSRIPDLLASDQATFNSLHERLADEVPFDRTCFDQIKNRPQRASELEALSGLYITLR
jgi:hypothetical protein